MLDFIVDISRHASCKIENGTLFCEGYIIQDFEKVKTLEDKGVLENSIHKIENGEVVLLELTLAKLHQFGFYENCDAFLASYLYEIPEYPYFIYDLNCREIDSHPFIIKHSSVVNFINAIEKLAKHNFQDADVRNAILFREDKSALLPFVYSAKDLANTENIDKLDKITATLVEDDSERKFLFVNELIENINSTKQEQERFVSILMDLQGFYEKCNSAYQFYLRDFSYNKLKLEIDSKALEYTQKIQAVINDAQTKLIAIPTAFVFVFTVLDFADPLSVKSIGAIISLFIFATLIQLFLNNQQSTLKFIEQNIDSYIETFTKNEVNKNGSTLSAIDEKVFTKADIEKISEKFKLVDIELTRQNRRLRITQIILWLVPIFLLCTWVYLCYSRYMAISILFIISAAVKLLPYFKT